MKNNEEEKSTFVESIINFFFPHNKVTLSVDKFDKELTMNFAEIVTSKGYPLETHEVITEDGYILTLFRLYDKQKDRNKKKVVYFQHGLFVYKYINL